MEDEIFFSQSNYIKEMLKKFGLEDSKPTKTPMSTKIKLTKDDEAESVDSTKYREDSMGTPVGRVILFGTIPTTIPDTTPSMISPTTYIDTTPIPTISPTIPSSLDYTPVSPNYSPASDTEIDPSEDPSSDHIPPLPATSPFLSSTDESSDSDILDTPPSPTHGTPFTKTTLSTQRLPTASGAL
ncbi:hypothetical protein Tco_0701071 [Tanacetum coccineum]